MSMLRSLTRLAFTLAIPAAGALALSPSAQANVRTTVTGSQCVVSPTVVRMFGVEHEHGVNGSLFLYSPSDPEHTNFGVDCPLTRSLPLATAGLSDLELRFQGHSTQSRKVECFAVSVRTDGTVLTSLWRSVIVPANGTATMDFGGAINASMSKGTYSVSCLLPFGVPLVSVYHSEVDGISGN